MIGWLSGRVRHVSLETAVVEVGGVGWELTVPARTLARLREGDPVDLWVHTHAREDLLALFGFASERDRAAFRALQAVSGVGPRVALSLVGAIDVDTLAGALTHGDLKVLTSVAGVGKRLAERLCVELRDKADRLFGPHGGGGRGQSAPPPGTEGMDPDARDAVQTLVRLGFREGIAAASVATARARLPEADLEALLREALREARRQPA